MKLSVRNLLLGLVSILVILVVYLVITLSSGTKPLVVEKPPQPVKPESNSIATGQIGQIGDVNITQLDKPVYKHFNAEGFVDREITFVRILHAEGDKWQVEKPQISFFRNDLSVIVSADKADIQTETVLKEPRPKDASLSGNVVVHIQPKGLSELKESFIYLDNISFESESSRAFTNGAVKYVSSDVELTGQKMEFVYNGQIGRLEFLKIDDINSLKIKVVAKSFSLEPAADNGSNSPAGESAETIVNSGNTTVNSTPEIKQTNTSSAAKMLYRCFFNNSVCIDSNSQLILTDQFIINNILINQSPAAKAENTNGLASTKQADSNSNTIKDNKSGELMPVSITCRGGILVIPMDSQRTPQKITPAESIIEGKLIDKYTQVKGKAFILGRQLTYDAISNDAILLGNCSAKMLTSSKFLVRRYSLLAQRIQAAFLEKNKSQSETSLKYVKADGGVVELDVEKIEEGKTLGFTKIKCSEFNYNPAKQNLSAVGPGLIAIDNSKMTQKENEALKTACTQSKFTLRKPSYALIENFKGLEYNLATGHILAQTDKDRMNIGYMPVIDGKYGQVVKATVGKVEAKLIETETGSTELVKLYGSGGVTYDEQNEQTGSTKNKNIQIVGSDFLYNNENPQNPVISVWGNPSWPCYLNGVRVDGIEYSLSTGSLKETRILAPAIIW